MRKTETRKADILRRDQRTEAIRSALALPLIPGLEDLMSIVGLEHAIKPKITGTATRDFRWSVMTIMAAELAERFRLVRWKNLRPKHIHYLVVEFLWAEHRVGRYCLKSVKCYLSTLRVMVDFMGKPGMVGPLHSYLPDVAKSETILVSECVTDKSWDHDVFVAIEEHFRPRFPEVCDLVLAQHIFGLRIREACRFDIQEAVKVVDGKRWIHARRGTKNGRPRWIEVLEDWVDGIVTDLLARYPRGVRLGATSRRQHPEQIENHYQYALRALGYTKKERGKTSHGLRHGFSHRRLELRTGTPAAVKGGDPRHVDRVVYRRARKAGAEELGHGRPLNAYGTPSQRSRRIDEALANARKLRTEGSSDPPLNERVFPRLFAGGWGFRRATLASPDR